MIEIEFNYDGVKTIIQCNNLNEKIKSICQHYLNKINEEKKNIYFLYNGNTENNFNEELTLKEMMNTEDKKRNKMSILVFKNEIKPEDNDIIKSKDIICPECSESIRFEIKDYKINLSDCKNGHRENNILLNEFEKGQYINNNEIKCEICNDNNKSNSHNKIFFKCLECKKNICPLCKSRHDKTHKIINYDERLYICNKHYKNYNSYCEKCKMNLCTLCEGEHKSHKKISLGDMMPNENELIENNKKLKYYIDLFNHNVNIIINILKEVIENMNLYYKINEDIINNYNSNNRNYEILYNLHKIKENNIIKELENVIMNNDIEKKFCEIFNIYHKMNIDEINITYKVNEKEIRLFGDGFVERNKNNCKMIINGKEKQLKAFKKFKWSIKNIDKFEVKLKGIMNITDLTDMFNGCRLLRYLPDISEWNTSNIINMSYMFLGCELLSSLPDISKWNTSYVTNMSRMFAGCVKLSSFPDISKWNTSNVTDLSEIFNNCILLSSLPDISKWNTSKVIDMNKMFNNCKSLSSLPDISKWNTSKVIDMNGMFSGCSKIYSLPDISKWNTFNVTDMTGMFGGCAKFSSLPDISKWNTSNVTDMTEMFEGCSSLSSLPDISKWNTSKVKKKDFMFNGCKKSLNIPT